MTRHEHLAQRFDRHGRSLPVNHGVAVGAERAKVHRRVDDPLTVSQRLKVMNVNEALAERAVSLLKVEAADCARVPVNFDAFCSSGGVAFISSLNYISLAALSEKSLFVRHARRRAVSLACGARVSRYAVDPAGASDILSNAELRALTIGFFRLKDYIAFGIKESAWKALELVIPVAGLAVERVFDPEIPTLREFGRRVGAC